MGSPRTFGILQLLTQEDYLTGEITLNPCLSCLGFGQLWLSKGFCQVILLEEEQVKSCASPAKASDPHDQLAEQN